MGTTYEGEVDGSGVRLALVVARFNEAVTTRLLSGAREAIDTYGVRAEDVDTAWVPGAFELPMAARRLAESKRYDAIVCLGAVIRGETPHFDYVSAEAARGVREVGRDTGVPTVFGVITPDTRDQALARAGGAKGNKGADAVATAIEMVNLLRQLPQE